MVASLTGLSFLRLLGPKWAFGGMSVFSWDELSCCEKQTQRCLLAQTQQKFISHSHARLQHVLLADGGSVPWDDSGAQDPTCGATTT